MYRNDETGRRSADDIISAFRKGIEGICLTRQGLVDQSFLLENELLVHPFGKEWKKLTENEILTCEPEYLRHICETSYFTVLGGIGFTGNNPVDNATKGYYQDTITYSEDALRTERFARVYEKILLCADDNKVVVLTHTPMRDWSTKQYNPNWVYISGHTHRNELVRKADRTTVLSDNQIGYKQKRMRLKGFLLSVRGRYDPFEDLADGIHHITKNQYLDFNRGRGIKIVSFKYQGELIMIKRESSYMFFLKKEPLSLYYLEGGRIRKADHDINYYYENILKYNKKIKDAFGKYEKALSALAEEVKKFGGNGEKHGCIVNIDFYNHLYLNPFDGKITPYFALDMENKIVYGSVLELLEKSPIPPSLTDGTSLAHLFSAEKEEKHLHILAEYYSGGSVNDAIVPQIVLDKDIYAPSRIMRAVQYSFDQQVIRIWNDEVLTTDFESNGRLPLFALSNNN